MRAKIYVCEQQQYNTRKYCTERHLKEDYKNGRNPFDRQLQPSKHAKFGQARANVTSCMGSKAAGYFGGRASFR